MESIPPVDLCLVPTTPLPDQFTQPNFDNPSSLSTTNTAASIILLVFAYVFVLGRLCTNKHKLNWSDYATVLGLILFTGNVGVILAMTKYNRHQWDIPACWFDGAQLKRLFTQLITFAMTQLFSKAAIILLYREIFSVKAGMRLAIYTALAFDICLYLSFIPIASVFIAPRAGESWETASSRNDSSHVAPWVIVIGIGSVLLDVYIFILPLPVVYRLTLSTSNRLQLLVVFSTAFLGVVASIVSLAYRVVLFRGSSDGTWFSSDSTWNKASLEMVNTGENAVALIVGSAPGFAAFFKTHIASSPIWTFIRSMFCPSSDSSGARPAPSFSASGNATACPRIDLELRDVRRFDSTATAEYDNLHEPHESIGGLNVRNGGITKVVTVSQHRQEYGGSTDRLV